jgi:fructose-1,6-bisphosphatase-3
MSERLLLKKIDYDQNEITIHKKTYPLENTSFATVNTEQPDQLIRGRSSSDGKLLFLVQHSEKHARHINFLMKKAVFISDITETYLSMAVFL